MTRKISKITWFKNMSDADILSRCGFKSILTTTGLSHVIMIQYCTLLAEWNAWKRRSGKRRRIKMQWW